MFLRSFGVLKNSLPKTRTLALSRCSFRSFVSIPEKKDADSIIPILDTIENKTASSFNDLMKQLASTGRSAQTQMVYDKIFRNHEIKANIETFTHLLVAYINDRKYNDAMDIYRELRNYEEDGPNKTLRDLRFDASTYFSMLDTLTKVVPDDTELSSEEPIYEYSVADNQSSIILNTEGNSSTSLLTALTLFSDMRHLEIPATVEMYTSMLKACTKQGDGYVLEKLHNLIRIDISIEPNTTITNHLLEAYYAVGNSVLFTDVWNVTEAMGDYDSTSISIALRTFAACDNLTRANHVWELAKDTNSKIKPEDFNRYLICLLRNNHIEEAEKLLQEGITKGVTNETSVNILEKYQENE